MNPSKVTEISSSTTEHHGIAAAADLGAVPAAGTPPVAVSVATQHDLLARVEARLAKEMLDLSAALNHFASGAQAVHKELPESSQFGKHVTLLLSSFALQFAQALLKDSNRSLLLDDGALHLHELGLGIHDFLRQVDLDGRRFLAVALIDQQASQMEGGLKKGQPS